MVVDAIAREDRPGDRLRRLWNSLLNKASEELDDTQAFRRRANDGEMMYRPRPSGGINVPSSAIVGFLMYLIAQTAGGIWWAATMQSRVEHSEVDRAREEQRLWDSINNYHLEINALRLDIARVQGAQSASQGRQSRGNSGGN